MLDKEKAGIIKGIAALFVMLGHILNEADWYIQIFFLGALWVGIFFFYSGYGLQYSIKNKDNYLSGFIKNKVVSVLIPFIFAEMLYYLIVCGVEKKPLSIGDIILCSFGIKLSNPILWYVVEILFIYLIFYIVKRLEIGFKKDFSYIWLIAYAIFVSVTVFIDVGISWYVSTSGFVIGLYIEKIQESLGVFISSKKVRFLCCLVFASGYFYFRYLALMERSLGGVPYGYFHTLVIFCEVPFFLLIISIIAPHLNKNRFLILIGNISYEVYLFHMCIWKLFSVVNIKYVYKVVLVMIATLVFSYLFNVCYRKIIRVFKDYSER